MTTGPYHTVASPAAAAVAASARRLPGESRCPRSAISARATPPPPVPRLRRRRWHRARTTPPPPQPPSRRRRGRPARASPPPPPLPGVSRSRHAAAAILSVDGLRAAAPVPLSKCRAPPRMVARISPRETLGSGSRLAADDGGAGAGGRQPSPRTMARAESVDASNDNGIVARKTRSATARAGRSCSGEIGEDGKGGWGVGAAEDGSASADRAALLGRPPLECLGAAGRCPFVEGNAPPPPWGRGRRGTRRRERGRTGAR